MQYDVLNGESRGCCSFCLGEPYQSQDERKDAQKRFRAKDVQFLITCDLLTEGFDYDGVDIVVPKPSRSRSKMAQMVGRGTRPIEGCVDVWDTADERRAAIANSPKPWCTVIDTCGASEEHSLIDITDIFRGRYSAALSKPKEPPKKTQRPDDIEERRALRNARNIIESERLAGMKVEVDYELVDTDMMKPSAQKAGAVSRSQLQSPATEPQCRWLENHGFRVPEGLTKRAASEAIGSIRAREDAQPASPGQKAYLAKLRLPTEVTRGEARSLLDKATKEAQEYEEKTEPPAG